MSQTECLTSRCVTSQLNHEQVNITNTSTEIQRLVELTPDDEDLCHRLLRFYHCLLNLVNEECLINRVFVVYFNEIETRLRLYACKLNSVGGGSGPADKNSKFFYFFKSRFFSNEFVNDNDDDDDDDVDDDIDGEDDSLDGKCLVRL